MSSSRRITVSGLARMLHMDRRVVTKNLKDNNVFYKFTSISNAELDKIVRNFRRAKPGSGLGYLIGHLRRCGSGLRIQRRRVLGSIKRVDGLGQVLRRNRGIRRRRYNVPRPNALWHVDGHHKLILWGIVIHGFVDGYSRTVRCSPVQQLP